MEPDKLLTGRGVTRACSKCHTPLASRIKIFGFGSLYVYCPDDKCQSYEKINIGYKFVVTVTTGSVMLFILFYLLGTVEATHRITCRSFKTWEEAQNAYNTMQLKAQRGEDINNDWPKYSRLDGNNNGKVCEDKKYFK